MFKLFRARKGLTKSIFWVLILVMAAGMVVFFVPQTDRLARFRGSGDVVATIGDMTISSQELKQRLDWYRQQFSQSNPGGDLSFLKQLRIEQRALDDLIQQQLVEVEAARLGIAATPAEISDKIQKTPGLVDNGKFVGRDEYLRRLQRANMTPTDLENTLRRSISAEKLQGFVSDGLFLAAGEVRQEWLTRNQKATIDYVVFDPKTAESEITPTDAQLQEYFNQRQEQYKGTEERKVKYLFIDQENLRRSITVTDQELREAFEKNPGDPEIRVSHILLKTENKSEQEIETIRKQAEELLTQARGGADFAVLARTHSQDEGSAPNGGEMPFTTKQNFVPEFADAAIKLKPGEITDSLVKTMYGFHIIKLLERRETTLELRRGQLEITVKNSKLQDETRRLADSVDAKLRQSRDLSKVAQEFNLSLNETAYFKTTASVVTPIRGAARPLVTKVFQLKNPGELVTPAVKVTGGYIVAQLVDIKPPSLPPFQEVHNRLSTDYKKTKAEEQIAARAEEFAKLMASAKDMPAAAKQAGLEVHTSNEFKRNDSIDTVLNYAAEVADKAFALNVGESSGVVTVVSGNKKVVFLLKAKTELDPQQFEKDQAALQEELMTRKRQTFFQAYLNGIKEKMEKDNKIHINQEVLKRYSL